MKPTVVVAGASGFVGQALGAALADAFTLIGLSRSERGPRAAAGPYAWRQCDLFSLLDAEHALAGADYAVYAVHSMLPSARLEQGSFEDRDLLCADNFGKAAAKAGLKQIVYLGGHEPEGDHVSRHLASRVEVQRALEASGVPVTTLRAGMIIGADGSSYQMLVRLVRRLPALGCPRWTKSLTQPVGLRDVVAAARAVLGDPWSYGRELDLGVPEPLTYRQMMERTAELLGLQRRFVDLPAIPPALSRLWVSLVTGAPKELARPLLESLVCSTIAQGRELYARYGIQAQTFDEAMREAIDDEASRRCAPAAFRRRRREEARAVRSVQRLAMPAGRDAVWAAREYLRFLPRSMAPLVRVRVEASGLCRFFVWPLRRPALELILSESRSDPRRQLFYILGGRLARTTARGRLEFRLFDLDPRPTLLVAIHDFEPRLPWRIYVCTQALVHLYVVWSFGRHLRRQR